MNRAGTIYLIHIEQPVGTPQDDATRIAHGHGPRKQPYTGPHAQHRLGHAEDLESRIAEHREGAGSPLLRWCNQHGIGWDVVRTWTGDHKLERRLSNYNNSPDLCPVCNPDHWQTRGIFKTRKKRGPT